MKKIKTVILLCTMILLAGCTSAPACDCEARWEVTSKLFDNRITMEELLHDKIEMQSWEIEHLLNEIAELKGDN